MTASLLVRTALLSAALTMHALAQSPADGPQPRSASDGACPAFAAPTGLSSAQAQLVTRAAQDPIIGCAVLQATFRAGDVTIAPGDTVRGNLVVLDGTLRVSGTVSGSAYALNGAVIIDSSGHVSGDVLAAEHGAAIAPMGTVDGELRTLDAIEPAPVAPVVSGVGSTLLSLKKTAAWFGILILLAVGVLTNAGDSMQRVTTAVQQGFGRNVTVGVLAQLGMLPVLVASCLMLALTVLGILLIPFAVVAYVIAILGLVVLGGLGAVQMVGSGLVARRVGVSDRAARLQALVVGMVLLSIPWLAAAALASRPTAASWIRMIAIGVTWIAATAGLGAALRTRGGTRSHTDPWGIGRPAPSGAVKPQEPAAAEWLTPTPLTGVVAVKRPTVGSGSTR